jgi:hypothetical protein
MRLRLAKVDEYQFLTCLRRGLWGSKSARFKDWQIGDNFGIIVNKRLAALAEVVSKPFTSKEKVWDNGLFPYRIQIRFVHVAEPENRPTILGPIRDTLTKLWGTSYGWGILNQGVIASPNSDLIVKNFLSTPNGLEQFNLNIDILLEQARLARAISAQKTPRHSKRRKGPTPYIESFPEEENSVSKRDRSEHTKLQSELVNLGKITSCSVWLAANDQARKYQGKLIGEECLKKLPNLGLSEEATKQISLIDVIWIKQNAPIYAFEIETSTSVYSGLLRLSDLISVVPALKIKLFIVAPADRQDKVFRELSRPTFKKIGLSEYCTYASAEDLHELIDKVKDLRGSVQPCVIERISVELEDIPDIDE